MKNNIRDAIFKYAVSGICRILAANALHLAVQFAARKTPNFEVFFFFFLILDGDSKNFLFNSAKKKMTSRSVGRRDISHFIRPWPCLCHSQVTVVCLCVLKKSRCAVHSASARDSEGFLEQGLRYLAVVCQAANTEMSPIFSSVVCLILKSTRGGIKGNISATLTNCT